MKLICIFTTLLLITGIAAAADNASAPPGFEPSEVETAPADLSPAQQQLTGTDGENSGYSGLPERPAGGRAYAFLEVNWSVIGWLGGDALLGLDEVSHNGDMYIMTPRGDSLYFADRDNGTLADKLPLDPANSTPFGCYPYGSVNVNDFNNNNIFHSTDLGISWTTYTNPAGEEGRGMDVDYTEGLVWQTYDDTDLISFSHLSPTGDWHDVSSVVGGQMSGLAIYENGGDHWLFVTGYNLNWAYIFDLDNSLDYLGTADYPYPTTFEKSYGLTYSSERDTFFWSFKSTNGSCYLIELELEETALEQSTWGTIKSSF